MEKSRLPGPPPRTDYLQDKMVAEDEGHRAASSRSMAQLSRQLPSFPHELELKAELDDEEELLGLYREVGSAEQVEQKKQMALSKRNEIAQKKIGKLEEEKGLQLQRLRQEGLTQGTGDEREDRVGQGAV